MKVGAFESQPEINGFVEKLFSCDFFHDQVTKGSSFFNFFKI